MLNEYGKTRLVGFLWQINAFGYQENGKSTKAPVDVFHRSVGVLPDALEMMAV